MSIVTLVALLSCVSAHNGADDNLPSTLGVDDNGTHTGFDDNGNHTGFDDNGNHTGFDDNGHNSTATSTFSGSKPTSTSTSTDFKSSGDIIKYTGMSALSIVFIAMLL